ncbi:NAD(P)/FAD-dependent oxidoreductase [Streptomyces sp. NPDC021622]|uniref:NAD(P)/FAD-dependent oxidoreductase n=1 Tax=unclassified Streptomyces TaxID=2593676 RepID=UPI000CA329B1|nr:halogenase [Streptomyces sp.]
MTNTPSAYDVVVIGGGPAGSTTAALLAREGHRVLLLEKEKFPRYHIGESLIPGCLGVVEELGLWDRLEQLGFTKKYGGTLLWGATDGTWDFRFSDGSGYDYSFQARRADFDALLLTRARELGADVVEEATVKDILFDGDRATGLLYTVKGRDEPVRITSRMIVDASGQGRVMGRRLDLVEWHEDLRNVAVWSYFQGCGRISEEKAGDIVVENMWQDENPPGWFWFIPLSDGTVSIGYVTRTALLKESGLSTDQLFEKELAASVEVRKLTADATRVSAYRTLRDWSYECNKFHGPGWAIVGDAAAFVDPLFSTGVTLAMRGALSLSTAVDTALREPAKEAELLKEYEDNYRTFLGHVLDFVRFFYNVKMRKEQYWEGAQEIVDPERKMPPKIDFAALLSGITGQAPSEEILREAKLRSEQIQANQP